MWVVWTLAWKTAATIPAGDNDVTTVPIRLAPRLWARLCLGAVLVSILILGALVVRWAIRRQDHVLRTYLRYDAYVVANAIPQDRLAVLDRFHDRPPPRPRPRGCTPNSGASSRSIPPGNGSS